MASLRSMSLTDAARRNVLWDIEKQLAKWAAASTSRHFRILVLKITDRRSEIPSVNTKYIAKVRAADAEIQALLKRLAEDDAEKAGPS